MARTDGVPLFVEELTKAVLEAGLLEEDEGGTSRPGRPPWRFPRPSRLADGPARPAATAKEVAQVGAVIGREFPYQLLAAVARCGRTS